MLTLPPEDYYRLSQAMLGYRKASGSGYVVKNYGRGLFMIKDDSRGQGRCIFFSARQEQGDELLTALLVYKKESREVPARVIEAARKRLRGMD